MDSNPGPLGPTQHPVTPPAPQGWSVNQPPPPPQWGTGQWNSIPVPMTPERRRRIWDTVSLGFSGGSLYAGIGGLLGGAIALGFYHIPVTVHSTGVQGSVDHALGRFFVDLLAVMFALMGLAGGGTAVLAGLVGLITRKARIAALAIAGIAVGAGGFALSLFVLDQVGHWSQHLHL